MNFEIVDPCPGSAQFGLDLVPTNFFVPFFFYALRLLHYRWIYSRSSTIHPWSWCTKKAIDAVNLKKYGALVPHSIVWPLLAYIYVRMIGEWTWQIYESMVHDPSTKGYHIVRVPL